ncbi:Uncharacterized protein DAT39_011739 [Clarias magur]|uniref:Uncharacterized protein n=1 Tax=Clarias magur TaxID=1594786 RepID=A0A8J4WZ96_CLAMG|nr:Uncharacterized protein DAT39_011739 [Clarias magur]
METETGGQVALPLPHMAATDSLKSRWESICHPPPPPPPGPKLLCPSDLPLSSTLAFVSSLS